MDVIERLVVTINAGGGVVTSEIDGAIQCKSFLAGNPQIKVALNEDLAIGHAEAAASGSDFGPRAVVLDDCNFHESVALDSFDTDRALVLSPPEGEFVVMSYRTSTEFRPPFRVAAHIEETGTFRVRAEGVLEGGGGKPRGHTAPLLRMRAEEEPPHAAGDRDQAVCRLPEQQHRVCGDGVHAAAEEHQPRQLVARPERRPGG